jgi:hypothetical protein
VSAQFETLSVLEGANVNAVMPEAVVVRELTVLAHCPVIQVCGRFQAAVGPISSVCVPPSRTLIAEW